MASRKTKSKTQALRGKERIQQLMEQFPDAAWRPVVSVDLYKEGIKANQTSRQLGRWAHPDAPWYFEYNKEGAHQAAERAEGYILNPLFGFFEDGKSFQYLFDSRSPYEVRYEERGRYRLYRDGDPLEEVFFNPRPLWYDKKTASGKPMPSIISQRGQGDLVLAGMTYCEYFRDGNGCRYCNINPTESVSKELGLARQTAKREEDVYETMLAACQESKQRSMFISGGVILDPSKEADMYARLTKAVRRAEKDAGYETPMGIRMKAQAMEPEDAAKLKEAGVTVLGFNTEVWDPKLFEWLCPGKAKYVGRERWLERLLKAKEVFGQGYVVSSFVMGLELAPPHGFKSEDEGVESYLEGWKWMLDHGIGPSGIEWRPAPGTIFEGTPSPSTEYFLRLGLARAKIQANYSWVRGTFG